MREGQAPKGTGAPTARLTHPQRGADAVLADEARWRRADLRQSGKAPLPVCLHSVPFFWKTLQISERTDAQKELSKGLVILF